jgi:hypothetical protein
MEPECSVPYSQELVTAAESKPYPRVLHVEDTLNSLLQVEVSGQLHERAALSPGNGIPLPNGYAGSVPCKLCVVTLSLLVIAPFIDYD